MEGEWRHSTWAEYAKFPLETIFALNEDLLLQKLGYDISDLCTLFAAIVPYGGLDNIDLKAGETIVIAPVSQIQIKSVKTRPIAFQLRHLTSIRGPFQADTHHMYSSSIGQIF